MSEILVDKEKLKKLITDYGGEIIEDHPPKIFSEGFLLLRKNGVDDHRFLWYR
jgi:hypothetical protein